MGLGMGGTMMPLFTSALKTLRSHEVARGSTLLNITQQIASSCGVALTSVVLTAHLDGSKLAGPAIAVQTGQASVSDIGGPLAFAKGLADAAAAFASTYWVAWVLVLLTLVPALMLPRRHEESHLLDDQGEGGAGPAAGEGEAPPIVLH